MARSLLAVFALTLVMAPALRADDRLIVHEWGTFTSLEDESGTPIGGINTDDEPVPAFVHDLHRIIDGPSEIPRQIFAKGLPVCDPDPDVRVRLETPVIYFHLPAAGPQSIKLDVDVTFHGGWLTQYYPDAEVSAPGLRVNPSGGIGKLDSTTDGTLSWHGLTIGTNNAGPATKAPVWLAPRAVDAAGVTTANNESERFLFYRGVGNILPPVQVSLSSDGEDMNIKADSPEIMRTLWLVDVKNDGRCAVRSLGSRTEVAYDSMLAPVAFADREYSTNTVAAIRKALKTEMVHEGLFADEADALLNTWETSYFRRPGLRLFFMVPTAWTNRVLPLHLSVDANMNRVMIGRIEIVTPQQRALLAMIAKGPASNAGTWLSAALKQAGGGGEDYYKQESYMRVVTGQMSLQSIAINIPADYRAYLQLGRFRNAIILDEARRRSTTALTTFMKNYALQPAAR
jgi:hypothetical protein